LRKEGSLRRRMLLPPEVRQTVKTLFTVR